MLFIIHIKFGITILYENSINNLRRNEFLSKPNTKTKSKIGCYKEHNFRSRESYKRMRTLPSATAALTLIWSCTSDQVGPEWALSMSLGVWGGGPGDSQSPGLLLMCCLHKCQ